MVALKSNSSRILYEDDNDTSMLPHRPAVLYEPSYRTDPETSKRFFSHKAKVVIDEILQQHLETAQLTKYNTAKAKE